jgi:hypothetical protein
MLFTLLSSSTAFSQLPVDNPYTTRYGAGEHWTNSIQWNKVTDARSIKGLIGKGNRIDSALIHKALQDISARGGGVLYFAAGKYYFNFNLKLAKGVVVRGAQPPVKDATVADYRPPTQFEFPKYVPSAKGCGTPHNAFKSIYGDTSGITNAGLVDLDINRAVVHFFAGNFKEVYTFIGDKHWPSSFHDNIIIYGIRQNNAVIPTSEVPTRMQVDKGLCWLRWPHPYIGNINIFVSRNALVANCRLNDAVTDNFKQPGYIDNFHGEFDADQAIFSYVDHPGVCLNAYNIISRTNVGKASGPWGPYGLLPDMFYMPGFRDLDSTYSPYFFPGEKKVIDNYIFTRRRHGKIASFAHNFINKGNVLEDTGDEPDYISIRGIESAYITSPANVLKQFKQKKYITPGGADTLPYLFKAPDNLVAGRKYPLVLFLHADDLSGQDNAKHIAMFMPGFMARQKIPQYQSFIIAPQENIVEGAWIDISSKLLTNAAMLSKKLLDETVEKYPNVDRNRIYVIGMAAGGIAAWQLAAQYPETFAAAVALDGLEFALTEFMYNGITKTKTPVMAGAPSSYGYLTWFLNTRLSVIRLKKAGVDAVYKRIDGQDRNDMMYKISEDDSFYTWLYNNSKDKQMNTVSTSNLIR